MRQSCDLYVRILIICSLYAIACPPFQLLHIPIPILPPQELRLCFKAEINVDGREITRMYLSKMDLEELLKVS